MVILVLAAVVSVETIKCRIGLGQRGKLYENGIEWTRDCPRTKYCIEFISGNIEVFQSLFDYPFDAYYNEYYARTCGGDLGSPEDYHPYRNQPNEDYLRTTIGSVKMNVTTPTLITGQGGTAELIVKYICRDDMCYENAANKNVTVTFSSIIGFVALAIYWSVFE